MGRSSGISRPWAAWRPASQHREAAGYAVTARCAAQPTGVRPDRLLVPFGAPPCDLALIHIRGGVAANKLNNVDTEPEGKTGGARLRHKGGRPWNTVADETPMERWRWPLQAGRARAAVMVCIV